MIPSKQAQGIQALKHLSSYLDQEASDPAANPSLSFPQGPEGANFQPQLSPNLAFLGPCGAGPGGREPKGEDPMGNLGARP